MKNFYLSDFKKVSSNKTHTIMEHKDGHQIHLSHDKMDKQHLSDLQKLPMHAYAKGGLVRSSGPKLPGSDKQKQDISQGFNSAMGIKKMAEGGEVDQPDESRPMEGYSPIAEDLQKRPDSPALLSSAEENAALLPQEPTEQQPSQDLMGTAAQLEAQKQGLQMQEQGLQQAADAEARGAQNIAREQQALVDPLERLNTDTQAKIKSIMDDNSMLEKELREGKINPNHYLQEQGTLSKVMTGIGLVLSGAGAGLSGQPNLAMEFLNKQIDNDIKAQMNNMENKQSLLNYNMKKMGNIQDAAALTKANLLTLTAAKMERAAQLAKDPAAKARAMQEIGKLKMESANIVAQTTARNNALKHVEGGQLPAEQAINALIQDKADNKEATKELAYAKAANAGVGEINNAFKSVKDIGPVGANNPFSESSTKFNTALANVDQQVRQIMKGQGALSDEDMKKAMGWYPKSTDRPEQLQIKLDSLLSFLKSRAAGHTATLSKYKIPSGSSFQPEKLIKR